MSVQNFMAIYLIVVEILQSGPKCWTDQLALPTLETLKHYREVLFGVLDTILGLHTDIHVHCYSVTVCHLWQRPSYNHM